MYKGKMRYFIPALVAAIFIGVLAVQADIVRYVDSEGVTHFVDSADKVPEQYRSQLQDQKQLPEISKTSNGGKPLYEKSHYEAAEAPKSKEVEIFVTAWCPYCRSLEGFLKQEKIPFVKYDIEKSAKGRRIYQELGGGGIPVVRIGSKIIQGFEPNEIKAALR